MSLNTLHPSSATGSREHFGSATEPQERAWPAIRSGENVLISAPTGSGKTLAAFLICLDDLVRAGLDGQPARRDAGALRLAAEGAQQRHPQEPRRAAVGHRRAGRRARAHAAGDPHGRPHRRHAGIRAPADGEASAAHPGHDAGVAVHPADGRAQPAGAAQRPDGDRRRDSRDGRRQARRASRAVARAARRPRREGRRHAAAAHRPVGDGQADRDGRAVPGARRRREGHHHRSRPSARDGSRRRSAEGRARACRIERDVAGDLRPPHRADSASTGPRWSSSTRGGWPSASRTISASGSAKTRCSRITAACRASCG